MVKTKRYYIFLEALLISIFLFTFGILIGIFIENARVNAVGNNFAQLETDILDARLISDLVNNAECSLAIEQNIKFADRVYWEALQLDKLKESNEITESIKTQHKKYDLLRAMIWMNSINIKKRCNSNYHNLVYIYQYENPSLIKKSQQKAVSDLLMDVKREKGDNVLLISLAGDIDSPSISLLIQKYNITEFPTILIDENIKITEIKDINDILKYLN